MTAGGRGITVGRSGVRRVLVATEVAFAVLLLVAAGSRRAKLSNAAEREGGF